MIMGAQWLKLLGAGTFLITQAAALDLVFVKQANCTGHALYGSMDIDTHMMNMTAGQTITFYSDANCKHQTYSNTDNEKQCFNELTGRIGSFKVDIDPKMQARSDASSEATAPHPIKLSDYSMVEDYDPENTDLRTSIAFIGVAVASAAAGAVTIYNTVNGCKALYNQPNPPNAFSCLGTPIGFILAYISGHFKTQIGAAFNEYWAAATGSINAVRKRELLDGFSADFMHELHADSKVARHVGFAKRDMALGEQTSPVYEIDGGAAGLWHVSAFADSESGQFIHHVRPANETEFAKRDAPYSDNSIRWKSGGFDLHVCQYQKQTSGNGLTGSQDDLYNTFYDQITCLHNHDYYGNAKALDFDIHSNSGSIVGEVTIVGYAGSQTNKPPQCNKSAVPTNSDCIKQ